MKGWCRHGSLGCALTSLSLQPAQTCEPPSQSKRLPGLGCPERSSSSTAALERAQDEEESADEVLVCLGS